MKLWEIGLCVLEVLLILLLIGRYGFRGVAGLLQRALEQIGETLLNGLTRPQERPPRRCGCRTPPVPVQLSTGETVAWLCPTCLEEVPTSRQRPIPPKGPGFITARAGLTAVEAGERMSRALRNDQILRGSTVVLVTAQDGTDLGFHRGENVLDVLRAHASANEPPPEQCGSTEVHPPHGACPGLDPLP